MRGLERIFSSQHQDNRVKICYLWLRCERHRAIGKPWLNMCRGRSVLTCVTDILLIDRIRATTELSVDCDVSGPDWPHEVEPVRFGTDID